MQDRPSIPALLTLPEVATACRVSETEVKSWVSATAISYCILGGRILVHPLDLEDFLRRRKVRAWGCSERGAIYDQLTREMAE